jgi:hypothetical protein
VAQKILQALHIQSNTPRIIACPTCARNRIDLFRIAEEVEKRTQHLRKPINIAVMGCAVNGPGEAAGADIGIAAGDGEGLIYIDGKISRKVKEDQMVAELMKEIEARWGGGKGEVGHATTVGRWVKDSASSSLPYFSNDNFRVIVCLPAWSRRSTHPRHTFARAIRPVPRNLVRSRRPLSGGNGRHATSCRVEDRQRHPRPLRHREADGRRSPERIGRAGIEGQRKRRHRNADTLGHCARPTRRA